MTKQRLRYRRVFFWLWMVPTIPWFILAIIQTLGAFVLDDGGDVSASWVPVVATAFLSLVFLLPSAWLCRRWVHPTDHARMTSLEQRRASLAFVMHTALVVITLQIPLYLNIRAGELLQGSEAYTTALVWAVGGVLTSLTTAAIVGWYAIRSVRVD